MVEALLVAILVACFFLALLDYIPNKFKIITKVVLTPWFRVLLSLIVSVFTLLLIGMSPVLVVLLALASSFASNALLIYLKRP